MSLTVDKTSGFKKTTTFNFTTTIVGSSVVDFGDGNFANITNVDGVSHTYDNHGIYFASITDCGDNKGDDVKIIVEPHIEDSVDIKQAPSSGVVGKVNSSFIVDVCSNCPPPIKIKLNSSGTETPFEHKLNNDWLKDVTPKKYFSTSFNILDNIVTLGVNDVVEYKVGDVVCGYKARFCFDYYDDSSGEIEISTELLRDCDICNEELRIPKSDL